MKQGSWQHLSRWGVNQDGWDLLTRARTPFFVYSTKTISDNIQLLKKKWPSCAPKAQHRIFFSVKSNPNPYLLSAIAKATDGFDASSTQELKLLGKIGISPDRITLSGPAKNRRCLELACQMGIRAIHLDSPDEYQALHSVSKNVKSLTLPKLTLRVALQQGYGQKLGMTIDEISSLLASAMPAEIHGFHVYLGRDGFSTDQASKVLQSMAELRKKFQVAFSKDFEVYFGAGLSAFEPGASESDLQIWPTPAPSFDFPIHLEAGRCIVANSGCYATRVLSTKETPQGKYLVVIDGGLQHFAATGRTAKSNARQAKLCAFRGKKPLEGQSRPTDVYGSLGISHDLLLSQVELPCDLQRGDWLVFDLSGAYGYTAACNQFIGPSEISEWQITDANGSEFENITPKHFVPYHLSFDLSGELNREGPA